MLTTSISSSTNSRSFPFISGQFVSAVAADPNGKQQTRAYSIASAANGNHFDLCVNRVAEGFFSNHLADLPICLPAAPSRSTGPTATSSLSSPSPTPSSSPPEPASLPCAALRSGSFLNGPDGHRSQRRQRDLARLRHAPRKRNLLPRGVRSPRRAQAQLPLPAHAQPRRLKAGPAFAATCRSTLPASSKNAPHASASRFPRLRPIPALLAVRTQLRHLRLHLRPQQHGRRRPRTAGKSTAGTASRSSSSATTNREDHVRHFFWRK